MNHQHHEHHHHPTPVEATPPNLRLALSATLHCLIGCGIGEVIGVIIGTALGMSNINSMVLGLSLGAVLGLALGVVPLLRAKYSFVPALKQVIIAEGLSIVVMETAEAIAELNIPGLMDARLSDTLFWFGMLGALTVGFIAALPVNYVLVRRGVRHVH